MLENLAARVRQGGTLEICRLAADLHASVELVEAMLEYLQRQGLIRDFNRSTQGCKGCGLRSACSSGNPDGLQLWHSGAPTD